MPFKLSHLGRSDIKEFAAVDAAAMKGWAVAEVMAQGVSVMREDMIVGFMEKGWDDTDKTKVNLKITDTETGKLVAAAMYQLCLEGGEEKSPSLTSALRSQAPAPAEAAGSEPEVKKDGESEAPRPDIFAEMAKNWKTFKDGYIKDQPYVYLRVLFTHPDQQRKGAGSMLVKWGCDLADEKGVIAVLNASAAGYHMYTREGFELVHESELDLKPYGVDAVEARRSMIRKPKAKQQ